MPDETHMLFIRPRNCHDCIQGYWALSHMVQYAQSKGLWEITDISEEQANKEPVYNAIDQTEPLAVYGFGHGNNCSYTGDSEYDIFSCTECGKLSGRVVYLLSCLTANGLGPEIIKQGALAYAGFNISWTWIAEYENEQFVHPDPYDDPYAYGFYESANELWKALLDGKEFHEAVQQSINKYDQWIDYWFYENPGDPFSQDAIMYLAHNRDGLVALNVCDVLDNETDCLAHGCYWYNNSCHSTPYQQGNGMGWLPVVLLVGVIGTVIVASQYKPGQAKMKPSSAGF